MLFCPTCSSILTVEEYVGHLRYKCRVCPYNFNISKRITVRTYPKLKVLIFICLFNGNIHYNMVLYPIHEIVFDYRKLMMYLEALLPGRM